MHSEVFFSSLPDFKSQISHKNAEVSQYLSEASQKMYSQIGAVQQRHQVSCIPDHKHSSSHIKIYCKDVSLCGYVHVRPGALEDSRSIL